MPRFYFHRRNSSGWVHDQEGSDLPDKAAVMKVAVSSARGTIADEVKQGRLSLPSSIEVDDELGRPVLTLRFRDAIDLKL